MSANKGSILVRLQEVKHWQGNFDNLYLQKKCADASVSNPSSDCDTVENSCTNEKNTSVTDVPRELDFDKIKITPPRKPFEQLLEEKLAEIDDSPVNSVHKPKRPFLKKGSGLSRYRLKYDPQKSTNNVKNNCKSADNDSENGDSITPLKIPEMRMKSKGIWCSVNSPSCNEVTQVNSESAYSNIQFSQLNIPNIDTFFEYKKCPHSKSKFRDQHLDNTLKNHTEQACFDNSYQRELDIFEALEKRVENSSFCSTNSSVIQLLTSSTPQKRNRSTPNELEGPEGSFNEKEVKLQKKLEEVHHKTEFINNFMTRLKRLSDLTLKKGRGNETGSDFLFSFDLNNSCDDSASTSSLSTDFESTNNLTDKHDNCNITLENATPVDHFERNEIKQRNYFSPKEPPSYLEKEVAKLKSDKSRLNNLWKESERKVENLSKEYEKMKHLFDTEIRDLKLELDNEKKKYLKEKQVFETYIKEIQNKPTKKEKEEILLLKRELTEVQELLKLKETKNGSTQARLRTQIKSLEKEVAELKTEVQKLTKENSKLTAAQKMSNRRPQSDLKMLKEINKNLSKLAEQKNNEKSDDELKENRSMWEKLKSMETVKKNPNTDEVQVVYEVDKNKFHKIKGVNTAESLASKNYDPDLDMTNFCNITLERKYEEVFGDAGHQNKVNNATLNDSKQDKIESMREDGTKEIKYSNGNVKTISPDEKLIIMKYFNGDVKETDLANKTLKYYYAATKTWHIQNPDGSEVVEFPNGQTEKKYKDGKCEIHYPDGVLQTIFPDGTEKAIYPDGSVLIVKGEDDRILHLPNGQKEIHTKDQKRREYPDGTVKILYPDGTQETRFANGRIRIKDANGTLLMDTENPT